MEREGGEGERALESERASERARSRRAANSCAALSPRLCSCIEDDEEGRLPPPTGTTVSPRIVGGGLKELEGEGERERAKKKKYNRKKRGKKSEKSQIFIRSKSNSTKTCAKKAKMPCAIDNQDTKASLLPSS